MNKKLSRREFFKSLTGTAIGLAAMGKLGAAAADGEETIFAERELAEQNVWTSIPYFRDGGVSVRSPRPPLWNNGQESAWVYCRYCGLKNSASRNRCEGCGAGL